MAAAQSLCFHCGQPQPLGCRLTVRVGAEQRPVCCSGCQAAADFILEQGLERFYQFRDAGGAPPPQPVQDWSIYEREAARRRYVHRRTDGSCEVRLQLLGLHCPACVWLIDSTLRRLPGLLDVSVSLSDGRTRLHYDPQRAPLSALLAALQRLGFSPRPLALRAGLEPWEEERRAALRRLAVSGFGMMQVMTFAVCLYAGALDGIAADMEQLLRYVSALVATPVVLFAARPFFTSAWHSLRARAPGMDVPVALSIGAAYLWSLWVTLAGTGPVYFDSAVMFTFLLLLGRYIEMALRHRAGQRQDSLARLLPQSVQRLSRTGSERVTPEELECGDRIRILAGERLPADGRIECGTSEIDESLLTGESAPRLCRPGDPLLAGTLNLNGVLEVRVTRAGQDSTLAAVARLLERAQASRPPVADLADRVAGVFVAFILLLSIGVAIYWWHADNARAFPAVLAVLVVTCPCALSLATPAALAAASARLAAAGVLVTRGRALERLAGVDRVVFDKTGTLTRGQPRIESVELLDAGASRAQVLSLAAALELYSAHPLARAFAGYAPAPGMQAVKATPGHGIEGTLGAQRYRIGQLAYVLPPAAAPAHAAGAPRDDRSCVYLADEGALLARFALTDALREDALDTLVRLQQCGVSTQIASGDRRTVVSACARRLGITAAQGQLSAADKLDIVHALQDSGHRVLMVGDGINDAPVLAAADVSAAVGTGTDLAQVSADLILMGDGLKGLCMAVRTSRRMLRIIRENLLWAVAYNLTAVPMAASGRLQPWVAALGMSISSLLVALNALRLLPTAGRAAPLTGGGAQESTAPSAVGSQPVEVHQ